MTVISENLDLPTGANPQNFHVTFFLANTSGAPVLGFHIQSAATPIITTIVGRFAAVLATDGSYSVNLKPNSEITPTGSRWMRTLSGPGTYFQQLWNVPMGGPFQAKDVVDPA